MEATEWIIGIVVLAGTAAIILYGIDWFRAKSKGKEKINWEQPPFGAQVWDICKALLYGFGAIIIFVILVSSKDLIGEIALGAGYLITMGISNIWVFLGTTAGLIMMATILILGSINNMKNNR